MLEGVAASGARLIVLGYGTDAAKVRDKLMLQAGLKIVAAHAFFVRCKRALPASKVVLFLDGSDTVHLARISHHQTGPCLNPLSSPAPLGLPSLAPLLLRRDALLWLLLLLFFAA